MAVELEKLSREELQKLQEDVDKALRTQEKRQRSKAVKALHETAAKYGFTLEDLVSDGGKTAKARYANPNDPSQTWSGRGRKPRWVMEVLEAGGTLDDMTL